MSKLFGTVEELIEDYAHSVNQGITKLGETAWDMEDVGLLIDVLVSHDFGWALRQMRKGLCVRLDDITYRIDGDDFELWIGGGDSSWFAVKMDTKQLLATDWAVCADPEGE